MVCINQAFNHYRDVLYEYISKTSKARLNDVD
jgi:hypothetical protein